MPLIDNWKNVRKTKRGFIQEIRWGLPRLAGEGVGPSEWSMFDFEKHFGASQIDIPLDSTLNTDPGT